MADAKREGRIFEPHAKPRFALEVSAWDSKNVGEHHDASSASKVFAAFMSSVSKPSVN